MITHASAATRQRAIAFCSVFASLVLVACGESTSENATSSAEPAIESSDAGTQSGDDDGLDLDTLTAVVDGVTLDVESLQPAFVGEVSDGLYIGVAVDPGQEGESDRVTAYLCDGELVGEWLSGTLENGSATLHPGDSLDGYDPPPVQVELEVVGDGLAGMVSVGDQFEESFTARPASGAHGLLRASGVSTDEERSVSGWIVLDDGRLIGNTCFWRYDQFVRQWVRVCRYMN